MAIIKLYNKDRDVTYVYESVSYWDKDKKQPRSKRKLIGKIDPVTGEIVPTGKRGRKKKSDDAENQSDAHSDTDCNPRFYSSPKERLSVTLSEGTV